LRSTRGKHSRDDLVAMIKQGRHGSPSFRVRETPKLL
jgi:hypothetical protein